MADRHAKSEGLDVIDRGRLVHELPNDQPRAGLVARVEILEL
ncbi:hypothetical protein ACFFX0_18975 [Citricoccus parietis]|uniref:Uncharacterized protein n=1 Tax=Citricoccus parietis TaxID=592307 RepID=A0ABV5G2L6_9MICC